VNRSAHQFEHHRQWLIIYLSNCFPLPPSPIKASTSTPFVLFQIIINSVPVQPVEFLVGSVRKQLILLPLLCLFGEFWPCIKPVQYLFIESIHTDLFHLFSLAGISFGRDPNAHLVEASDRFVLF
jgi:hypothetical protein